MITIDMNDFTFGEIEEIEQTVGVSFGDLFSKDRSGLAMAALVWVTKRRDDPSYTLEQAKLHRLRDIEIKSDSPVDPTANGASGSSSLSLTSSTGH